MPSEPYLPLLPQEDPLAPQGPAAASPANDPAANSQPARKDPLLEIAVIVGAALLLAFILKSYVAEAYMVRGESMRPTFLDGQRVMVQKVFYEIERGDIIIFASKLDLNKDLIKRVIGLPGERIQIRNGRVFINGRELEEDYINKKDPAPYENHAEVIPPDTYYVLGDNRQHSQDSRVFHGVDRALIKGKVILLFWPPQKIRSF
ncbi:MAG: signal peptidase I [Planctomycetes bacterium]|nr:signal peptidase I [Planctomycetota bacterium]